MDAYTDTHTHKIKGKMLGEEKHERNKEEKDREREDKILSYFFIPNTSQIKVRVNPF